MKKFLLLLLIPFTLLTAQTPIQDVLLNPTDTVTSTVNGSLTIVSSQMQVNGSIVVKTLTPYTIANGVINFTLAPNDTSTNAGSYYTVNYSIKEAGNPKTTVNFSEKWVVPTSVSPLTVSQVRVSTVSVLPSGIFLASQLTSGAEGSCIRSHNTVSQWLGCGALLNGVGAPSNSAGIVGDFYLNTLSDCLYGPKVSNSVWPGSCSSLIGSGGISTVTNSSWLSVTGQTPGSWIFNNGLTHGEHAVIHGGIFYGPLDARYTSFTNSGLLIANPVTGSVTNLYTGSTIANLQSGCVEAAPALDNAGYIWLKVCTAATNGFMGLVRLNTITGTSTLSINMTTYQANVDDYEAVAYDPVNNLILDSAQGTLYGFNATTGAEVWTKIGGGQSGYQTTAPPLIEGVNTYWKDSIGDTYRVTTATGVRQASTNVTAVGDGNDSYAQIIYDAIPNYLLVTNNDNTAFILDGTGLSLVSSYTVDSGYCFDRGSAFNPTNGVWYVTARQCTAPYSSKVYALGTTGGTLSLLWTNTTALNNQWEISSLLADNNYVYAGVQATAPYNTTGNGYELILNATTGALVETFNYVDSVASSSPVFNGGKIITGLWDTFGYQALQITGGGGTSDFLYKADLNMTGYVAPWTNSTLLTQPIWPNISSGGTLQIAPANNQPSSLFIGTCGGLLQFAPCKLTTLDLPQLTTNLFNNGTNATSTTYWRGDGTWGSPAQTIVTGTITSVSGVPILSDTCTGGIVQTAVGALPTDVINSSPNTDSTIITGFMPGASLNLKSYPGTNQITFKFCNETSSTITPSSLTYNWRISR